MNDLRQREPRLVVPWLTELARGQDCTFRVPGVCNRNPETTVWCHSNESEHGKGVGCKSHDPHGAFGCSACHDWYDRTRDPQRQEVFRRAKDRTYYVIFKNKLVRKA
jgi:hypothetical protein